MCVTPEPQPTAATSKPALLTPELCIDAWLLLKERAGELAVLPVVVGVISAVERCDVNPCLGALPGNGAVSIESADARVRLHERQRDRHRRGRNSEEYDSHARNIISLRRRNNRLLTAVATFTARLLNESHPGQSFASS